MVGGYVEIFNVTSFEEDVENKNFEDECKNGQVTFPHAPFGGGGYTERAWIFDGKEWTDTKKMSVKRDTPSCSLIELGDGEVSVHFKSLFPEQKINSLEISLITIMQSGLIEFN